MSDTWTRGHSPDTRRIRVRYATWRIVDHLYGQRFRTRLRHGSNTVRTRLDYSDGERRWETVDLVLGFNRRKKEEEGRRKKGEGGRGEDESGAWGGGRE